MGLWCAGRFPKCQKNLVWAAQPWPRATKLGWPCGVMCVSSLSWPWWKGGGSVPALHHVIVSRDHMMDSWGRSAFTLTKRTCWIRCGVVAVVIVAY